jgi:Ty3 transposon capsid-like protein/Zinc knuckle
MENMEGTSNPMSGMEQHIQEVLAHQGQQFRGVLEQLQARLSAQEEELRNARLAGQREVPVSSHESGPDQGFRGTARYGYGGKVSKPPTYDGRIRDPSTINSWVLRMDDYLDLTKCPEDFKSRVAATYLHQNAFIWYTSVVEARGTELYYSWDEMKIQFRQYFLPPNADALWFDKWDQVRQLTSVQQYSAEFKLICTHLPDMPASYILNHFIRHLKREVQKKVELQQPSTLEDAMRLADRIDYLEFKDRRPSKGYLQPKWTPRQAIPRGNSTNSSLTHRSHSVTGYDPDAMQDIQVSQMKSTQGKFLGKCYNCGKFGHQVKECQEPRKPFRPRNLNTVTESKNEESQ